MDTVSSSVDSSNESRSTSTSEVNLQNTAEIDLRSVEQSQLSDVLSVAVQTHLDRDQGESASELEDLSERLTDDPTQIEEDEWNSIIRCLSYDDVREKEGSTRVDYLRSKLIRRLRN